MEHPLARYKREAGLNQGQVATMLDMPQSQVSRLMNRKRLPGLETIARIERVTGIPANEWTAWLNAVEAMEATGDAA